MSKVVDKQQFKLFPLNRNQSGSYSFYSSNPLIVFEFQETAGRIIKANTLRLNGRLKVFQRDNKQFPANRFDLNCSDNDTVPDNEKVCYLDSRVGIASCLQSVTISSVSKSGQIFEQIKEYPRMLSSLFAVSSSYFDLCGVAQNLGVNLPNNDCMSRAVSGEIPFSLSLKSGFLNGGNISLANGGIKLTLNLASDSSFLFGLNAQDFVYSLQDIYLSGEYLMLSQPVKAGKGVIQQYYQYRSFLNTASSSNDHQNLNLGLQNVISIYSNFLKSSWTSNSRYNSLSTSPLKGSANDTKKINQFNVNRGAVRYPLNFPIDESKSNREGSYDVLRSRLFLDSVQSYGLLTHTTISPFSEGIGRMVDERTKYLITPQSCDGGDLPQWKFNKSNDWTRTGDTESNAQVYGVGCRLDMANLGIPQNYTNASYNYSIQSELDGSTTNSIYTFVLSKTQVVADGKGNIQYIN